MDFNTILFEKKDGYALITLNRPDKLNALNEATFLDIKAATEIVKNDPEINAVIVTGSGEKAFAAGADIQELNKCDEVSGVVFSDFGSQIFYGLENVGVPVIAAVNGFALGGGCELAMACHIRFASTNAKFGQPEVNLGIIPGYGGTQRLPRLVGMAKAMELIISGNMVNAEEAKRIGLVNEVFPPEELMQKTVDFVKVVLSKGQIAVRNVVDTVLNADKLDVAEGLKYESALFGRTCGSDDFKEGTGAFLEKRKADFKNN